MGCDLLVDMAVESCWRPKCVRSGSDRRPLDRLWVFWKPSCGTVNLSLLFAHSRARTIKLEREYKFGLATRSQKQEENESESYDVTTYIRIFSFLWDVPYRWVRILVDGIFFGEYTFLISQTLIGKFVMEPAPHSRFWFYYCLLAK